MTDPIWTNNIVDLYQGDCREVLAALPAQSVHCIVTSPPYWGLRDYNIESSIWYSDGLVSDCDHEWAVEHISQEMRYHLNLRDSPVSTRGGGHKIAETPNIDIERSFCGLCGAWLGNLGLEPTPELYVQHVVEIFQAIKRVLRDDGTVWLNLGDSYAGSGKGPSKSLNGAASHMEGTHSNVIPHGLKSKDLVGIPWRVAFALQADGWYLRSDIIWNKPNPMPESVTDRPTKSHEYLFLLSKAEQYFYDADVIREPPVTKGLPSAESMRGKGFHDHSRDLIEGQRFDGKSTYRKAVPIGGRNKRTVWTIATQPFSEAHFATFPEKLIEPCILAGCPENGTVLDPFIGSGTTAIVAQRLNRRCIGIDASEGYLKNIAIKRISGITLPVQLGVEHD